MANATEDTRATRRTFWLVFMLSCAASWLLYLHRYAWGVLKPVLRREYPELSDTDMGWLDGAFMASYALGQVPGGLLADILGPRVVLTGLILLWSAAATGVAWTFGFWPLFAMRSAFGLAQAGAYPALSRLSRDWYPATFRTSAQGVMTAFGRVGAACSPILLATVLMGLCGLAWRDTLYIMSVPAVILAIGFWVGLRQGPPREVEASTSPPGDSLSARPSVVIDRSLGAMSSLGMMLVYAFASTFQDQLYVFWIPLFLVEGRGLDTTQMGLFTPLPLLGGAVGGILGGILNDVLIRKTGNRRWSRSGVGLVGKAVAGCLILVSIQVADGRLAMIVLLLARVFSDWSLPTQWGAVTDMGGRAAGTLFGLVNMVGALGGFIAGPVLGLLKQHYGWEGLFSGAAVMCFVAALTWLLIDCTRKVVITKEG